MSEKPLVVREATDEEWEEQVEIEGVTDEDYGFVLGPDGELKAIFLPDGFEIDPPPVVKKILKVLGVKDINSAVKTDIIH